MSSQGRTPRTIALIPARGGSKGIPRKNLALIDGRPLVAYTIEAALRARLITEVYVSSDDGEILDVAERAGSGAVKRPPELASDHAIAADVVRHFIGDVFSDKGEDAAIIYLQPTSPMRTAAHVDEAVALMHSSRSKAVISVTESAQSPFKMFVLNGAGELKSLFEEKLTNANRQALPATFIANGAIYGFRLEAFQAHNLFPSNGSVPYVMSREASVDVDTPEDLAIVRALMERKNAQF